MQIMPGFIAIGALAAFTTVARGDGIDGRWDGTIVPGGQCGLPSTLTISARGTEVSGVLHLVRGDPPVHGALAPDGSFSAEANISGIALKGKFAQERLEGTVYLACGDVRFQAQRGAPSAYEGQWSFAGFTSCPFQGQIVVSGREVLVRLTANSGSTALLGNLGPDGSFQTGVGPLASQLSGQFKGDEVQAALSVSSCGKVAIVGKRG
ncbi:MAG TPA: hypothetical protein VN802_07125 [Stellaceae bacterium]|nr:hypothetical protein [Stellaceae bacterium]